MKRPYLLNALALVVPAKVHAYGAAYVGYTHVGPNGAYHVGATEVHGGYAGGYGGAEYRGGYGGAEYRGGYSADGYSGGAAVGGYHYTTGYSGGAAVGGAHYEYIR
jgi:hypothetical protein